MNRKGRDRTPNSNETANVKNKTTPNVRHKGRKANAEKAFNRKWKRDAVE